MDLLLTVASACQLLGGWGGELSLTEGKKKNKSVKFKMHKMSACASWLGSAASVQLDMLIMSISFTSLDGSDVPEVISRVAFRRHVHH